MSRKQKLILIRIIVSAIFWVVLSFIPAKGILRLALYVIPYLIAGWDVLFGAFRNIINGQIFDENFLMSLATIGAFAIGEFPEAVAVMLFYQVGELFQSLAVRKSRRSISALMDIRPDKAVVLRNGAELTVSPEEVAMGETVIVKAGERICLDGIITKGSTSVDTSSLTGESMPVDKTVGDAVISGTINLSGEIAIETTSAYCDSTVAKILKLVEANAEKKAKTENFITRFARYYTPVVVIAALLLAVLPPVFVGDWGEWINRALIFLVVSCPCALVVSVPLTFFGGIGGCSKKGILVKGAVSLENLAKADTFVFDKTGTLTKGSFFIETVYPIGVSKEQLLEIATVAEGHSNHPIASCFNLTEELENKYSVTSVKEISGMGITAIINGKNYFLGNKGLMESNCIDCGDVKVYGTVIHIAEEREYIGYICIADEIKPETENVIKTLKQYGALKTVMLTGDTENTARAIAEKSGVDEFYHSLLPHQKVERVEELLAKGNTTAFVGDGINDAPVLTVADIGIAMGDLGSDAAIEAADIVIMDDKLNHLTQAVMLARKTMAIVKQNIIFALSVKGIILLLGALGIANMWIAVFGDVGVTVIAILNAMRTLYK